MLFVGKSLKLLPPEPFFLVLICTKSLVGWGFAPDPSGGKGKEGNVGKGKERKGKRGEDSQVM